MTGATQFSGTFTAPAKQVGVANDLEVRLPVIDERPDPEIARDAVAAIKTQLPISSENIEVVVAAAGGSRTDIVSLRLYIVGDHIHNALPVREALLGFFPAENLPTSTWIGVSALASKDFLIEIEAVAVLE